MGFAPFLAKLGIRGHSLTAHRECIATRSEGASQRRARQPELWVLPPGAPKSLTHALEQHKAGPIENGDMATLADIALADAELQWHIIQGERAYDAMYRVRSKSELTGHYSEIKESLSMAIQCARRMGRPDEEARLRARLTHIKAVCRSQGGF